jgi:hypothetical protein
VTTYVERLAGSFLVRSDTEFELVGQPKFPCDFASFGFARPLGIDEPNARRAVLVLTGEPQFRGPRLCFTHSVSDVASALERRLLVARNASASERLWAIALRVEDADAVDDVPEDNVIDADWVIEAPDTIWEIVRSQVLRCL